MIASTTGTGPNKATRRLVSLAQDAPRLMFVKGWYENPEFREAFLDRCVTEALFLAPKALEMGVTALEMAGRIGDDHLLNRANGVLAHVHISRGNRFLAGKTLADYKEQAIACCGPCRGDYFLHEGDLLGEQRKPDESLEALGYCLDEAGDDLDDDGRGQIHFLSGIAHYHGGNRDRALAESGEAFVKLSLDRSRGFFRDHIALNAVYRIGGSDPRKDAVAQKHLKAFDERIKGLAGWQLERRMMTWADAHFNAMLGNYRRALPQLKSAFTSHLADGRPHEKVALALDIAAYRCRHSEPRDTDVEKALDAVNKCLKLEEISEDHRRGLEAVVKVLERFPEDALRPIVAFRKSFVAPVPGLLGARFLEERLRPFRT